MARLWHGRRPRCSKPGDAGHPLNRRTRPVSGHDLPGLASVGRTRGAADCMPGMSALAQELKGSTRRDGINLDEEVVTDEAADLYGRAGGRLVGVEELVADLA